jgi:hypothetical protein
MTRDLNAPATRWKWMKIHECRKPFIKIRSDDHVVSYYQQKHNFNHVVIFIILSFFLVGAFG